jgi:hypothetical protein
MGSRAPGRRGADAAAHPAPACRISRRPKQGPADPARRSSDARQRQGQCRTEATIVRECLQQLDALEAKTEGGQPFWVSHAGHYDFASDYTHPERFAPAIRDIDDPKPIEALGVSALTWGHQYLALAGSACAMLAELPELENKIEARYAAVVDTQRSERERVFGN